MNLLEKTKCTTKTNYKGYYSNLSKEQLIELKLSLKNQYIAPLVAWMVTLTIMLFANIEFELMILFSGSAFATCFMLYSDYKKRYDLIRELIDSK